MALAAPPDPASRSLWVIETCISTACAAAIGSRFCLNSFERNLSCLIYDSQLQCVLSGLPNSTGSESMQQRPKPCALKRAKSVEA